MLYTTCSFLELLIEAENCAEVQQAFLCDFIYCQAQPQAPAQASVGGLVCLFTILCFKSYFTLTTSLRLHLSIGELALTEALT